jgi:hypothetical protein
VLKYFEEEGRTQECSGRNLAAHQRLLVLGRGETLRRIGLPLALT